MAREGSCEPRICPARFQSRASHQRAVIVRGLERMWSRGNRRPHQKAPISKKMEEEEREDVLEILARLVEDEGGLLLGRVRRRRWEGVDLDRGLGKRLSLPLSDTLLELIDPSEGSIEVVLVGDAEGGFADEGGLGVLEEVSGRGTLGGFKDKTEVVVRLGHALDRVDVEGDQVAVDREQDGLTLVVHVDLQE